MCLILKFSGTTSKDNCLKKTTHFPRFLQTSGQYQEAELSVRSRFNYEETSDVLCDSQRTTLDTHSNVISE